LGHSVVIKPQQTMLLQVTVGLQCTNNYANSIIITRGCYTQTTVIYHLTTNIADKVQTIRTRHPMSLSCKLSLHSNHMFANVVDMNPLGNVGSSAARRASRKFVDWLAVVIACIVVES